jgi:hypothetical protein
MYYAIYKITNQINGKFYIGSHKTEDLDDKYMGSGKYLKRAQEKYGFENFKKEILFVFETAEDMYAKEAEIVNEEFLAEENTYNLKIGGFGGFNYINSNPSKYLTPKRLESLMSNEERTRRWKIKYQEDSSFREKIHESLAKARKIFDQCYPEGVFKGKTHSNETKRKMSASAKRRCADPTLNSQYGTMWITNGVNSIKVKKTDNVPEGWRKGRTLKLVDNKHPVREKANAVGRL